MGSYQQMTLVHPTRRVAMRRLGQRQRDLLTLLRTQGELTTDDVRHWLGYRDASAAMVRLVERGLARRTARGHYRPVRVGEASHLRDC